MGSASDGVVTSTRDPASTTAAPARGRLATAARVLFWPALTLVLLVNVALVIPGLSSTRLWEDEAYNLSVPINLAAGLGYASDGWLLQGTLAVFDHRISTGPVVLLPIAAVIALGVEPVLAGRATMVGFVALWLLAAWLLGREIGTRLGEPGGWLGRWAGVAAMASFAAYDATALPSPMQGRTDILGEVPAAALVMLGMFLLLRATPDARLGCAAGETADSATGSRVLPRWTLWLVLLGGLAFGLAVQSKTIALLAVPAAGLFLVFAPAGIAARARVARAALAALGLGLPTLIHELARFAAQGWPGYLHGTRDLYYFLRDGGQPGTDVAAQVKLAELLGSWFLPAPLAVAAAGLVLVLAGAGGVFAVRRTTREELQDGRADGTAHAAIGSLIARHRVALAAAATALVTLIAVLLWWVTSSHLPNWPRHPSPIVLSSVPALGAIMAVSIASIGRGAGGTPAGAPRARVPVWIAVAAALSVAGLAGAQSAAQLQRLEVPNYGETLADQRLAARAVADTGLDVLQSDWGPAIGIVLMSGADGVPSVVADASEPPPQIWAVFDAGWISQEELFEHIAGEHCMEELLRLDNYLLCDVDARP